MLQTDSPSADDFMPKRRSHDIDTQELDDEIMVIDTVQDRAHFLNSSMAAVWKLCDGSHTRDQIARGLAEQFDCGSIPALDRTVQDALKNVVGLGFIERGRPIAYRIGRRPKSLPFHECEAIGEGQPKPIESSP